MPIYEFECLDCGHQTEILMNARETDLAVCGRCGSRDLRRLISAHAAVSVSGRFPSDSADRCCGSDNPAGCAGPGSCCGKH